MLLKRRANITEGWPATSYPLQCY